MTVRPAVVVAAVDGGPVGPLLWVLMITNARRPDWPGDVPIPNAMAKGLLIPCKVRTTKVATVVAAQAKRLGSLDRDTLIAVMGELRSALAGALTR